MWYKTDMNQPSWEYKGTSWELRDILLGIFFLDNYIDEHIFEPPAFQWRINVHQQNTAILFQPWSSPGWFLGVLLVISDQIPEFSPFFSAEKPPKILI